MRFEQIVRFLTILMATAFAFVASALLLGSSSGPNHKQKEKELRKYVQAQWINPASVHKIGPEGSDPKFVVVFIHGFLGFHESTWANSWNEYAGRFAPALQDLSYIVYHPGLNQMKEYQSFAQGLDVYQARQHLERVLEEVDKPCNRSSLGGHSVTDLPVVCIGHSNGAATLVATMSQHHILAERIKGLILLAPYADIREASTLAKIKAYPGGDFIAGSGMRLLYAPMYDASQPSPLQFVREGKFPDDLPALFIHSHNDHVVPIKNYELFKKAFAESSLYFSRRLVSLLDLHSGGHNWMWQRVQLTHAKASKESLTPEQRKQEKHVKHQSYLSAQDRSALSAALHNFIKQYVLDPSKICHKEADGTFACVTSFLRRCFK